MKNGIKVFAPATVSNVCCGFDILGFAIHGVGDEIIGKLSDRKGLRITKITGDQGRLPLEVEKNTAGLAAQRLLEHLGEAEIGIDIEIRKKMPFGSGLGSSAASAVAGAMLINEMFNQPLEKRALMEFAMEGEKLASGSYHCDNVAPSLLGGLIMCRDSETFDVHRIYTPPGLYATVVHPNIEILTKDARNILSNEVSLKGMIEQSGNLASLVLGMMNSDLDLIKKSLHDAVIEPQRAKLIPHFYDVKEAAINAGALGCSISGSGPSIFALSPNSKIAEEVGERFKATFSKNNISNKVFVSEINNDGAVLI
ncbi:MAG: homoserine kinase [Saprospiraceae bacterium]